MRSCDARWWSRGRFHSAQRKLRSAAVRELGNGLGRPWRGDPVELSDSRLAEAECNYPFFGPWTSAKIEKLFHAILCLPRGGTLTCISTFANRAPMVTDDWDLPVFGWYCPGLPRVWSNLKINSWWRPARNRIPHFALSEKNEPSL